MKDSRSLELYLVTDRSLAAGRDLEQIVAEAVKGGVTMVQLREKDCPTPRFIELGRRMMELLRPSGIPLIINDNVEVALAVGANGVHIGQSDMPYWKCRQMLGKDAIIGLSIENFEQLEQANCMDVDYVAASPVFATPTKTDTARPWGLDGLREFVKRSAHPVVAIGGMNSHTAAGVMECGVVGIAVVSDIICAPDPTQAAATLKRITSRRMPTVLTIAGSDSGGGAGIQADIKAIQATGSYAASAITAVTVQNTLGVQDVFPIPVETVRAQIRAVCSDLEPDAIKIGMLANGTLVQAVAETLRKISATGNIVLDPVMVATSGDRLLENDAVRQLLGVLAPMARVITPNIDEAVILAGTQIYSQKELAGVGRMLSRRISSRDGRPVSVLMKAGHLDDSTLIDCFYNAEEDHFIEMPSRRIHSPNTHGTGCTMSSAFASYLAQGMGLDDAAQAAKQYISAAIEAGARYRMGHGHGPVDHFFMLHRNTQR